MALVERKDIHRYATELAEQFGPIFKFRIFCFHVHPSSNPYAHFSAVYAALLVALCASSCGVSDSLLKIAVFKEHPFKWSLWKNSFDQTMICGAGCVHH